jgi:hypothetical protein
LLGGETTAAKNGLQLIDAEMHAMEPVDLWERYIDPKFAERAPRRLNERRSDIRTIVEGEIMGAPRKNNGAVEWTTLSAVFAPTGRQPRNLQPR